MLSRLSRYLRGPVVIGSVFVVVSNIVAIGIRVPRQAFLASLPPGVAVDYSPLRVGVAPLEPGFVARVLGGDRTTAQEVGTSSSGTAKPRAPLPAVGRILDDHTATNDGLRSARSIPRPPFTARTNTAQATRDPDEPSDCGAVGGTIWYRYRSRIADGLIANTFGTPESIALGVFAGSPGNLRNVGCDTDIQGNAVVAFVTSAATDYYFQIASPAGGGPLVFSLDLQGRTTMESVSPAGEPGDNISAGSVISGNGRIIAFGSLAKNIVPGLPRDPCISHEPYGGGTSNIASKATNWTQSCYQIFARDLVTGKTVLVSASPEGEAGNAHSYRPGQNDDDRTAYGGASLSWDGRYVAFISEATNLVPGDTNGLSDAFVRDLWTGKTERVSVDGQGRQVGRTIPVGSATWVSISHDGRIASFASYSSEFLPPGQDTNADHDVFVRDRVAGTTTRVSVSSTGEQKEPLVDYMSTDNHGFVQAFPLTPCLSGNGRYVAFRSVASNLVPGDTNGMADIFVHDRVTHRTARVSVGPGGRQANLHSQSWPGCLSADGRFVVFGSRATNLVDDDTNGLPDIFVHDRLRHVTRRVSISSAGRQSERGDTLLRARVAVISSNGRYVAFHSIASDLVEGDQNAYSDVFIHDLETGTTSRVSSKPGGGEFTDADAYNPSISGDGRRITFDAAPAGAYARAIQSVAPAQVYLHERSRSEP